MHKERDPRVVAVAEKLAMAQPYGFEHVKSGPSAADYHAALIAVQTLDALVPEPIEYGDIRAGDIIKIDYGYGFSVGVALHEEPLYADPECPERVWKFDGMDYLGCLTGNWMMGGQRYRIHTMEFSEWDEKARGWMKAEQEKRGEA